MSTHTRTIRAIAKDAGWTVTQTNGNHLRLSKPGHRPIFTSLTPSDHRTLANLRARLRRAERTTHV